MPPKSIPNASSSCRTWWQVQAHGGTCPSSLRRNFAFHGAAFVFEAGFAFGMMERRLKAEVYHSDGEGRAV